MLFWQPRQEISPKTTCVTSMSENNRIIWKKTMFSPCHCSFEQVDCNFDKHTKVSSPQSGKFLLKVRRYLGKEEKYEKITVSTRCCSGRQKWSLCYSFVKLPPAGWNFFSQNPQLGRKHYPRTWFSLNKSSEHTICSFDNRAKNFTPESRKFFAQYQKIRKKNNKKIVCVKFFTSTCRWQFWQS